MSYIREKMNSLLKRFAAKERKKKEAVARGKSRTKEVLIEMETNIFILVEKNGGKSLHVQEEKKNCCHNDMER